MEVELSSMMCEELMLLALKQLASDDKQARKRLQIQAGNRDQIKAMRYHLHNCMLSLSNEMTKLEGRDLVPEYLCTDDLQDLVSRGLIRDVSKLPASRSIEVDLTNPKFKLKREKIFKDAKYRVNPVALLLRADKIPHRGVKEGNRGEEYPSTHQALKKTPKPSPKRHQTLATTSSRKQTYSIDVAFGSQDFKLHLHVRCHCSLEQSKFVEWLRSRGGKSFGLEELTRRDDLMQGKVSGRTEETARNVLRFLCFVGYVTLAKIP
ncbi:hypothetical protein P3T76_011743 [Phytophthora citrophthora]|uniref:Uncharacterized protein n=1 Tax=Phytophthora citrophthora TaxID=4793 RepID=A0AAD9LES3_9STRA|nr:hypothetical protein P3T76_011743 [Phytophthora citrophthora]